jgi:hypothetical protein
MYAIPVLEQVPVAAPFDPRSTAVENTVIVFGPRPDLAAVPFDAVLLSTVYSYFHVIGGRRSYQNKIRGHIYSSAIADLPWNDDIAKHAAQVRAIRGDLLKACERRYEQATKLAAEASALGLRPLKEVVRGRSGAKIAKSEAFADEPQVTLAIGEIIEGDAEWILPLDGDGGHTIRFNVEEVAQLARAGLVLAQGIELSWNDILNTLVPISLPMEDAPACGVLARSARRGDRSRDREA